MDKCKHLKVLSLSLKVNECTALIAVVTMGQLIESSGYVIRPFNDHPQLLSLMLRILAEEGGRD